MTDWAQWRQQVDLDDYEARWAKMEAACGSVHGEADLVTSYTPHSVLDGGCGTGRVGIELAKRGMAVVGVDLDIDLLDRARAKAPELVWHHLNLAKMDLGRTFDVVVLAGNVVRFVAPAEQAGAVAACARHLKGGGRLIAGFQLGSPSPSLADYDRFCVDAGLLAEERFASWDREPFSDGGNYAVSVHRRAD